MLKYEIFYYWKNNNKKKFIIKKIFLFSSNVFTKSDKENQRTVSKNVKDFLEAMRKTWQFLPRHFVTSAVKKSGRTKILSFIGETNDELAAAGKK